ncbi:unnamed protein product [Rhizoctonia solani]|uniref:Inhibitor I9 domain-containing protein n=1 Tax=Rhizoctonia solani TaxID=456999 RepID=A0A8H2XLJ8_9AGAM|nr:unnamed protein product [Rhizoctonia solani]
MSQTTRVAISKAGQDAIPGMYIVTLKPHSDLKIHLDSVKEQTHQRATPSQFKVLHQYHIIKGYQAKLDGSILDHLTQRDDVNSIVEERRGALDALDG